MAGVFDFTLDQGSDTTVALTFYTDTSKTTPINLSGYAFACQIRENLNDETFIDELTSANSRIDISSAATGKIILIFPSSISKLYNFSKGYYDLESTNGTTVTREMQGKITLDKEATK